MLIDIISTYDNETKSMLRDLRTALVLSLVKEEDPRKILTFLKKSCILGIDEPSKKITIGVPNDFSLQQVKKFFKKPLQKAIAEVYNPHFTYTFLLYSPLQQGDHPLHIDIAKLLQGKIQEQKKQSKTVSAGNITLDKKTANTLTNYFGILFEAKYSFENFVVGSNNQLAHSAAIAITESPGEAYNPFFIYGNVGLGKTHLMQAIGNTIIKKYPQKTVLYLPTTKFIDHIIKAIRFNKLSNLMERLEQVDVLMLDDVQFLAGKEKTQEIFHNIFNDFHSKQKQIVVTCDQAPKELTLLHARLQSRFSLGLVTDIKSPDLETKIAILQHKLKKKGESLDPAYIELIATTVTDNIRELEGALNIVLMKKKLLHQDIGEQDIIDSLTTLGFSVHTATPQTTSPSIQQAHISRPSQANNFAHIIASIALHYDIAETDLLGKKRTKEVSFARQLAMYIGKKYFNRSLQKIGNHFGGKNHASVIYAIKTFETYKKDHPEIEKIIQQFI